MQQLLFDMLLLLFVFVCIACYLLLCFVCFCYVLLRVGLLCQCLVTLCYVLASFCYYFILLLFVLVLVVAFARCCSWLLLFASCFATCSCLLLLVCTCCQLLICFSLCLVFVAVRTKGPLLLLPVHLHFLIAMSNMQKKLVARTFIDNDFSLERKKDFRCQIIEELQSLRN